MNSRITLAGFVALVATLVFGVATAAAVPAGNLLTNGDGEAQAGITDATTTTGLSGWEQVYGYSPLTVVQYGSPGWFPGLAESTRIGGGQNFIAGGPDAAQALTVMNIELSAYSAEIDAGGVQMTLSACLGGYGDEEDYSEVAFGTGAAAGFDPPISGDIRGPTAAERGAQTELLPRSVSRPLPAGTRLIQAQIEAFRMTGTYNDGYIDNVSLRLSPAGSAAPTPVACGAAAGENPTPSGSAVPAVARKRCKKKHARASRKKCHHKRRKPS